MTAPASGGRPDIPDDWACDADNPPRALNRCLYERMGLAAVRFNKREFEGNWTLSPPVAECTTEALWPTGCPACFGPIRPGDVIGLVDGDWLCSGCFE